MNVDPGLKWIKDPNISIKPDSPLDNKNIVSPNVLALNNGKYCMFYSALGDIKLSFKSQGYILRAYSNDGINWIKDPNIKIGNIKNIPISRTVSPNVIKISDGFWRMYIEARKQNQSSSIISAISSDLIDWEIEDGERLSYPSYSFGSPNCIKVHKPNSSSYFYRLYFHRFPYPFITGIKSGNHILSATSIDGLNFEIDEGVRINQDNIDRESLAVYAPNVTQFNLNEYRMFFSGWGSKINGGIFTAYSKDGLFWIKNRDAIIDLDRHLDMNMVSEPSVIQISENNYRMYYEAEDKNGVRNILSASSYE